ncbi:MAG: phosphoribosylglycinamide formyltransferase [Clostridiales bacterium]|jgi:phosphoribosylglycinamide formyltransferase-1|nr:phosphoribosylglycinamide formyltransferase [Clostridiales bacterium]
MLKIGVLISGGGTNLQAIIDNCENGKIDGEVVCVISSSKLAYGLTRAKRHNIPAYAVRKKDFETPCEAEREMLSILEKHGAEIAVTAGFLSVLSPEFIRNFPGRVINIHPSLIPSFCGKGFYGLKVHEAALETGVKITGATVHFADEGCDTGPIILQKAVEVKPGDTAEVLQKRVMEEAEHVILPKAIQMIAKGEI